MSKDNNLKHIFSCPCPSEDLLSDIPETCPDYNIGPNFKSVKFYGDSMVAMDNNGNYLGQWEYLPNAMVIKITKEPNIVLSKFNHQTGKAEFTETVHDITFTKPPKIESIVHVPQEELSDLMTYLFIHDIEI